MAAISVSAACTTLLLSSSAAWRMRASSAAASLSAEARISATSVSSFASRASMSLQTPRCFGAGSLRFLNALLNDRRPVAEHLRHLRLQQHPEERDQDAEVDDQRKHIRVLRADLDDAPDPAHHRGMLRLQLHRHFRIFLAGFLGGFFRSLGQLLAEFGIGILGWILLGSRGLLWS